MGSEHFGGRNKGQAPGAAKSLAGSRDERDVSVWELNEGGPRPPLRSEPAKPGSLCWESTFSKHRQRDRQTPALRAVSKPWSHRASHSLQLAWRAESQAQPGREVSRVLGVSGGVGRCREVCLPCRNGRVSAESSPGTPLWKTGRPCGPQGDDVYRAPGGRSIGDSSGDTHSPEMRQGEWTPRGAI